ncbi:MAG: hypothetical protein MJ016_07070 [Victivallaceae bacterium]|nr:hypothetical protein [Victivallaceae bacterium]
MKRIFTFFSAAGFLFAAAGAEYLVECEDFPENEAMKVGVWEIANGEKFLNCTAQGAESFSVVELPQSGDYYLWVRTLSFGGNFRKAEIYLNGVCAGILGDDALENDRPGRFAWSRSDARIHLEAGKNTIRLIAASAFTRIDALILSDDAQFKPAGKMENLHRLSPVREDAEK